MTAYIRTIDQLSGCSLDIEQRARTCGYWYTIRSHGTPETAFGTRAQFLQWLELRKLSVVGDIPAEGQWQPLQIVGRYRTALHLDRSAWEAIEGIRTMGLSNGDYTEIKLAPDPDGIICEHVLNPNIRDRPIFDYRQARELCEAGQADRMLWPVNVERPPAGCIYEPARPISRERARYILEHGRDGYSWDFAKPTHDALMTAQERDAVERYFRDYAPGHWSRNSILCRCAD